MSEKLNKLVTNYSAELTPEEIENLSATLAPVIEACGVTGASYDGDGKYIGVDNTNYKISLLTDAASTLDSVSAKFDTSAFSSISAELDDIFVAEYNVTPYADVRSAYLDNKMIYCHVNAGTDGQRLAFLAYAGSAATGNLEFQYYRSMTNGRRSTTAFGDEILLYTCKPDGWTTTTRHNCATISGGYGLSGDYNKTNNTFTLDFTGLSANTPLSGDGTSANPLGIDMTGAYTIDGAYGITAVPDTATNKVVVQMTNDVYQDVQTLHTSISAWDEVSGLSAKSTVSANTATNVISVSANSTATPVDVSSTTYYTNTADSNLAAQRLFVVHNDNDLISHVQAGLCQGQGSLFFVMSGFNN